ncbi:hypothetical protein GGI43DRAFT_426205 [Trichoderma evansii]
MVAKKKRGVPDDQLCAALKVAINDNLSEGEQSELATNASIVPSCYGNEEKVALVEFHGGEPECLCDLMTDPLGNWQVEMGDTDISFDRHFFGFTQLYTPRPGSPTTADIIAITGLDGHTYGSWRGKGNLGRMWLRDFLSKDLPFCRIMIYGYNSKLSTHGVNTIMDYSRGLIEELKKIRNTERKRPLFFIAHSFGGIILAHCLVKAVQVDENDHPAIASLHRATYGMLLFGITHKGLIVDDIQKTMAGQDNHPRSTLLEQIRSNSDLLAYQLVDFRNLIRGRKNIESKSWTRTGDFVTSVAADSALLQLPDSMEDKIPLDADHSMIVKGLTRKPQIAAEYAYRLRESAPQIWVFWVHASNATRFKQAYRNIADKVELPGRDDPKSDILRLLYNWLCDERNGRWLMIVDNADDDRVFSTDTSSNGVPHGEETSDEAAPLSSFLPQSSNGRILITSRDLLAAINLVGTRRNVFQVDPMTEEDALIDMRRDGSVSDAVITTWQISFEQIQKMRPEAAELLSLMAMFDRQGIPGNILYDGRDRLQFEDAVTPLIRISLVKALSTKQLGQQVGEHMFEMHDLVGRWQKASLRIMAAAFPRGHYETWAACRVLLPHASKVLNYILEDKEETLDRATIASKTSHYLYFAGEYAAAEKVALIAVATREEGLGADHPDTLASIHKLALVLQSQGNYKKAEAIAQRALEGYNKVANNLAVALENQGNYKKAEAMVLGAEHPDTLTIIGNVAPGTHFQGNYKEAEAIAYRALQGREKILGAEHPDTLASAHNLASVLKDQGDYKKAEAIFQRALEGLLARQGNYKKAEAMAQRSLQGREKVLGVEHPKTLISINNLAVVLKCQGSYKKAEVTLQPALEAYERVLGVEHPDTLITIHNLGVVLERQGKGRQRVLGVEHPKTITSANSLALIFKKEKAKLIS